LHFNTMFVLSAAHSSSISCLAIQPNGNILASGGSDETIRLYDLRKRVEVGTLMHHEGSISSLSFFSTTHMISASHDGALTIWRTKDWEPIWTKTAHKGGVANVAVHSSGRVALSLGTKDRKLKMWNLVNASCAHTSTPKPFDTNTNTPTQIRTTQKPPLKRPQNASLVVWSPSTKLYAVVFQTSLNIYDVDSNTVKHHLVSQQAIHTFLFLTDEVFVFGGEDAIVYVYHTSHLDKPLSKLVAHSSRIRGLAVARVQKKEQKSHKRKREHDDNELSYLISGSSDGRICVWDFCQSNPVRRKNTGEEIDQQEQAQEQGMTRLVGFFDTHSRITCIAACVVSF